MTTTSAERAPAQNDSLSNKAELEAPLITGSMAFAEHPSAAAFADHVTYVQQNGDSLDCNRRYFDYKRGLLLPAVAGITVGELVGSTSFGGPYPTTTILGYVTTAGISASVYRYRTQRSRKEGKERLALQSLWANGEIYELYRVALAENHYETVLRWYGAAYTRDETATTIPPKSIQDSLALITDLARKNGINTIFVESDMMQTAHKDAKRYAYGQVSTADWLERKKYSRAKHAGPADEPSARKPSITFSHQDGTAADHSLLAFRPARLAELGQRIGQSTIELQNLDRVIGVLRARGSNHPLVSLYDQYKSDPALLAKKLERTARQGLERNLEDKNIRLDREAHGAPAQIRVNSRGIITGNLVSWFGDDGKMINNGKLASALGFNREVLEDIMARPEAYPSSQGVVTAAEYAVYLFARGEFQSPSVEPQPLYVVPAPMLQEKLWPQQKFQRQLIKRRRDGNIYVSSASRRLKHLACATACFTVFGAMAEVSDYIMEDRIGAIRSDAHQQLVADKGVALKYISDEQVEQADKEAFSKHPKTDIYNRIQSFPGDLASNVFDGLKAAFDPSSRALGDVELSGISQGVAAVGNTPQSASDAVTEWQLQTVGDISSEGYWGVEVGDSLDRYGEWNVANLNTTDAYTWTPPLTPQADFTDYIKISRALQPFDIEGMAVPQKGALWQFPLPILEGTMPIAADLDGRPLKFVRKPEGTVSLLLTPDQAQNMKGATLTYELARSSDAPKPHAVRNNTLVEHEDQRHFAQAAWDATRPGTEVTGEARIEADKNHLLNNFTYSYEPLNEPVQNSVANHKTGWGYFSEESLEDGEANCNVAATLLATDNPALNVAWGYRNDGDQKLIAGEAHMWTVDAQGQKYDATPPLEAVKTVTVTPLSFDTSDLNNGLMAGAAVALGGLGWYRRKNIVRLLARQQLKLLDADDLVRAKQVADMAGYASRFDAAGIQTGSKQIEKSVALEALRKHQVHSAHVKNSIKQLLRQKSDKTSRRLLRSARRAIRTVERAGLVIPVKTADNSEGVL